MYTWKRRRRPKEFVNFSAPRRSAKTCQFLIIVVIRRNFLIRRIMRELTTNVVRST